MEIISVNVSKKNSRLVWLKFSDGLLLPFSADDFVLMHLKKFDLLDEEQFFAIQTASARFLLTQHSLRQVAISPKVRKLLIQKLRLYSRKINRQYQYPDGLVSGLIDSVVDKIDSLGLLDIAGFIDYFTRRHRRQSASQINFQLRQLGINQKSAVSDDVEKIKSILQKKYQPTDFSDYQTKRQIIAKLYQKGFAVSDIKTAIDDYLGLLVEYP
jgi:SOS response regulatory protein OraA/RecX